VSADKSGRMRDYWDERARLNAAWYVDTTLDFEQPDMQRFFDSGEQIVADHYVGGVVQPAGQALAVEIGSGLGRICRALRPHFDRVVGVDISTEMVTRARELVTEPGVEFVVGTGVGLTGVEDACADLVFSFTVFQHIPDPAIVEGYIAEAGRVLRPGGVFVFQWNNEAGSSIWRLRRAALSMLQRTGLRPETYGRHASEFLGSRIPRRRIDAALQRAGLELRGTRGDGTLFTWAWAVRTAG
jgi:SAM-dependent methyltransferase